MVIKMPENIKPTDPIYSQLKTYYRYGIANMCPHDLRRSYATDLDRLDVDIRQIQMGMGHKDRKTTEDYIAKLTGSNIDSMYKIKFKDDNKGLR